jgi:hypothetical protein
MTFVFCPPLATYFLLCQHNHISPRAAGEVRNNGGFYVDFARHTGMLAKNGVAKLVSHFKKIKKHSN